MDFHKTVPGKTVSCRYPEGVLIPAEVQRLIVYCFSESHPFYYKIYKSGFLYKKKWLLPSQTQKPNQMISPDNHMVLRMFMLYLEHISCTGQVS